MHPGAALGAFVAHDDHVAGLDLVIQDVGDGFVLRLNHVRRAFKHQQLVIDAGGFDDTAVQGDVAGQHRQTAFFGESVLVSANAAVFAVYVQTRPALALAESHLRGHATRRRHIESFDRFGRVTGHIPLVQRVLHGLAVHRRRVGVQLAGAVQLAQDAHDAAGAVHVFDVVFVGVGRDFAQLRHAAREAVNVGHGELDLGLLGNRQDVQDGIGGAAHRNVQRHSVLKRLKAYRARQHAGVVLLVVALAQIHRHPPSALEQLLAVSVRRHHGAVARQRQAQRFGQAVHRVGGEHTRA